MHALWAAHDSVHRARRDAQRAANASALVYHCDGKWSLEAVRWIQRHRRPTQQLRKRIDTGCATRRALIDLGFAGRNRLRVGATTLVAALRALRLRQQGVDTIG